MRTKNNHYKKDDQWIGLAHGGIIFSIADSCLAFAANSFGKISLTKNADIKFIKMVNMNDIIYASCNNTSKIDHFSILIS